MLPIQPRSRRRTQKELRSIRSRTRIGHAQNARPGMFQGKVLVLKLVAVDTLATRPIVIGKVTALAHETGNDAVKRASGVAKTLFARAEGAKVLGGFGNDVGAEFHDDAAGGAAADGHVKVDFGVGPGSLCRVV